MAMSCAAGRHRQARGWAAAGAEGMGMATKEQRGLGAGGCRRWRPLPSRHRPRSFAADVLCACLWG
jgi:hypothetical protein